MAMLQRFSSPARPFVAQSLRQYQVISISKVNMRITSRKTQVFPTKDSCNATGWIYELPEAVRPYARLARLDKPIGTWLYAWPAFWSITLGANSGQLPDLKTMALFGIASIFLRGAACTINDIFDRDLDAQVKRTKNRPLASGAVSLPQGWCFLAFQTLVGLRLLLLLDNYNHFLGIAQLGMFLAYPLMKRITYWPQAFLGFTFNWGALLGWFAIKGSLMDYSNIILPLYTAGIFWTLVYDTIYAHQDKDDDAKIGVKSTALLFGRSTKHWTSGFGLACVVGLALTGYNAHLGWPYYAFLVAVTSHLAWQIFTVDLSNPEDCGKKFVSNQWFGAILFIGILLGKLVC